MNYISQFDGLDAASFPTLLAWATTSRAPGAAASPLHPKRSRHTSLPTKAANTIRLPPFLLQINQSRDLWHKVVEIDLSTLEPHINGPFTPDLATPLSQFKSAAAGDALFFSSPMDASSLRCSTI